MQTTYSLRLNKAALIFFPPQYPNSIIEFPSTDAQVVQVMVKARKVTKRCIYEFYRAEREITSAIESIILAHLASPLPECLIIEGEGYVLQGNRVPWKYGQRNVRFTWGGQDLLAARDKWIFVLDAVG